MARIDISKLSDEEKKSIVNEILTEDISKKISRQTSNPEARNFIDAINEKIVFNKPQNEYTISYNEFIRNCIINIANWHVAMGAPALIYMTVGAGFTVMSNGNIDAEYLFDIISAKYINAVIYVDGYHATILKDEIGFFSHQ